MVEIEVRITHFLSELRLLERLQVLVIRAIEYFIPRGVDLVVGTLLVLALPVFPSKQWRVQQPPPYGRR